MKCGLDIEDHFRHPAVVRALDLQSVIGDRLDFMLQPMPRVVERFALGRRPETLVIYSHGEFAQQQSVQFERDEKLAEPVQEQKIRFLPGNLELDSTHGTDVVEIVHDNRKECPARFRKKRRQIACDTRMPRSAVCSNISYIGLQ